jgi:DNA-binding PadR family transcriptional regulator
LGALHGFGIARRLEQISRAVLQLNEGTVYTALLRLQQQGWITAEWGTSENNRKAKFYFVAQGMSREEASVAARRQFGNTTLLREDRRAMQTFPSIEAWWYDLRYARRVLWKERGFAAVSIVTLGLGIGAATAIFSVIYNVLLAPFPEKGADRMVFARIQNLQQSQPGGRQAYTTTEVLEFAANSHSFDGIIAASGQTVRHRHGEGTEQFRGALVSPGTFEFFGMPALHGRVMQPGDYVPGAPPVFVMRHQTWMTWFNGDLSLLDKTFVLLSNCDHIREHVERLDVGRRKTSAIELRVRYDC